MYIYSLHEFTAHQKFAIMAALCIIYIVQNCADVHYSSFYDKQYKILSLTLSCLICTWISDLVYKVLNSKMLTIINITVVILWYLTVIIYYCPPHHSCRRRCFASTD